LPIRFVGYITNFIHNRKDPAPNLIKGYSRTTLVRGASPAVRAEVQQQWESGALKMAGQIYLESAEDIVKKYSSAGSGVIRFSKVTITLNS
jgi:hypothetical protein